LTIPLDSNIAKELQFLYKKILLRPARDFELQTYLNDLESGKLQLSEIKKSIRNSNEASLTNSKNSIKMRRIISSLNKIQEGPIKTKDNFYMYLDPSDYAVSGHLSIDNIWEPFETSLFKKFIKKNSVFIDIGAHIGYYSLLCASKANNGTIVSFEPVPRNYNILQKNIALNNFKNIKPIKKSVITSITIT